MITSSIIGCGMNRLTTGIYKSALEQISMESENYYMAQGLPAISAEMSLVHFRAASKSPSCQAMLEQRRSQVSRKKPPRAARQRSGRRQSEKGQMFCSAKWNRFADDSLLKRSAIHRFAARTSRASSSWFGVNRFLRSFYAYVLLTTSERSRAISCLTTQCTVESSSSPKEVSKPSTRLPTRSKRSSAVRLDARN